MSRFTVFLFVFFASAFVFGSPIPVNELDRRVTHTGRGTFFYVGQGNCGKWNVDSDPIVAIAKSRYDRNQGANCDQWVEIINTKNGKKAYGKTRDSCQSCKDGDLDMSPSLFAKLDSPSAGVIPISWHFMSKDWKP